MHGPAKMLEIKLLGRFRHSGSHDDLPKKAQALLAYLAMNRGHAIPRDQLADLLWSTSGPEQGRQSLRQSLATVRRALGADARDLVETVGADVQLAASGAVDVDVHRFEMLAQSTARAGSCPRSPPASLFVRCPILPAPTSGDYIHPPISPAVMPGFNHRISHLLTSLVPSNWKRVSLVSPKITRWFGRAGYESLAEAYQIRAFSHRLDPLRKFGSEFSMTGVAEAWR